ncbi:hypothetical protein PJK55_14735 [Exiguobacterium sp. MMG028]|uniref:hypothetical protein n=1 Tax=Exiguobacterium sp. MMG028 TaxID=3021979 RepID=UPI0022FE24C7|nr:hypothetical protein [Exiguobacterium sp. MMG028]MDA5561993.1 hypothetical protein [Exiguobacterium sp. MMG028]
MNAYDKVNELNDIAADLDDIRERIIALGSLNANITGPISDAITQIDQAVEWQQDIINEMERDEIRKRYERLAAKYGAKRVKRVCYATMLKEMNGGTAV